jgi:dTDP-4-amino-4,6-dideoxygalactose transaminase
MESLAYNEAPEVLRPEEGRLFSAEPFYVVKEKVQLAGGSLTLNNEAEAKLLQSAQKTGQTLEMRVFFTVKGHKVEYNEVTYSALVSDMVIDTE